MQPVKNTPFCQWISIRWPISRILLQPFQVKHESVDLLLRGDDVGREQAAESEPVSLRHRERRAPVEPWVVEDVGAALVEHDGAVALRRREPPRLQEEEAVEGVGSPEAPRDERRVRHPRPRAPAGPGGVEGVLRPVGRGGNKRRIGRAHV